MKKLIGVLSIVLGVSTFTYAQFGFVKKADIETFKDSRLIVVLFADSTYNASIKAAVERFWSFNGGFEFVHDTMMKQYAKGDYAYLIFAKSKKSNKLKAKLCSSEDDFNGLVITKKYKKRVKLDEMIAGGACSNIIDTTDWYPELIRAVQILNNYFNYAIQAESDKDITPENMSSSYPADLTIIGSKKLLVETGVLSMKGKEDASDLLGQEVEEVDREEINKAILTQDPDVMYMYHVVSEKFCDKLFVSAANSEIMYFASSGSDSPCKCTAKELKAFKSKIDKANKER